MFFSTEINNGHMFEYKRFSKMIHTAMCDLETMEGSHCFSIKSDLFLALNLKKMASDLYTGNYYHVQTEDTNGWKFCVENEC